MRLLLFYLNIDGRKTVLIERSKLSQHKFEKGKLITPFNQHFQDLLKEESWYYGRMPEYVWLGLIVNSGNRNVQMEKCLNIMHYESID